jgi:hypothetical protein
MKKVGLLSVLMLSLASCVINTTETNWDVVNFRILASDWVAFTDEDGLNLYYTCSVNMPEITSFVYTSGLVQTYFVTNGAQEVLPYVRHNENANGDLWTRTVDCDYSVGIMRFYVTNSDFFNEIPPTMDFRVVIQQ